MFSRFATLGVAVLLLSACGGRPTPVSPLARALPNSASIQQLRTLQWSGTGTSGAKNLIGFSVFAAHAESRGINAQLNLVYGDRTGLFAGRSTLMAALRLETSDGDKIFSNVPMQLSREAKEARYFTANIALPLRDQEAEIYGLDVSFSSSDRYGHLTLDSGDGQNYRFTRVR